ncbi:MAG: glycosyltransferase family 87 protein, partial [Pseudomonadota bacterium]
ATARRIAIVCAALAAGNLMVAGAVLWAVYGPGGGATLMDFGALWAAGVLALQGDAAAAYDLAAVTAVQSEALGAPYAREMHWLYPPVLQLALTPLGALSLPVAQAVWTLATLALYLAVACALVPRPVALAAALAPTPAIMMLAGGQTGFLTAGLAGLALVALARGGTRREAWAGAAVALLACIKPPLALALPLVLLWAGRWRALAWAAGTGMAALAATTAAFGPSIWPAFAGGVADAVANFGRAGTDDLFATLERALQTMGVAASTATVAQAALSLGAVAALLGARQLAPGGAWGDGLTAPWQRVDGAPWAGGRVLGPAALALAGYAAAVVTPRVMEYDLLLLVPAALLHARHAAATGGVRAVETTALALALALPAVDFWIGLPLGWIVAPMLMAALILGERARAADPGSRAGAARAPSGRTMG